MNPDPAVASLSDEAHAAIQAEAHAWARALATGRPTHRDGEAFRRWRAQSPAHEQAWRRACRDWRALGAVTRAYASQRPGLAAEAAAQQAAQRRARQGRRLFLGTAVPALGALAVIGLVRPPLDLWPSWTELRADLRTATGQQRSVEVAGVRLWLNTRTSIAVQAAGRHPRIELIAGEAAVSAGGTPCDVAAGSGRIRLDAGDIEVRHLMGGQVRVRCNEGAAQVQHPSRTVALQAGQQIVYDARRMSAPASVERERAGWRQGIVAFHDLPLSEAIEEINRYRPGRVVLLGSALARHRISGRFAVDALDEAIVHIQKMYQAEVRRVGDVVFLS